MYNFFKERVQLHLQTPGGALTVAESIARLDQRLSTVNAARWGNTWIEPGFGTSWLGDGVADGARLFCTARFSDAQLSG